MISKEITQADFPVIKEHSTRAEGLDISGHALKRLLNHKIASDVTAGYIVTDVERLRAPMQKITDFVLHAAQLRDSAPIIEPNFVP